jgi:hypothetical protein
MKKYDLADAVTSLGHYSSATGTLWGIYAAATFAASGFGISMKEDFTFWIAAFLTIGFLAFTIGHLYFIIHHVRVQRRISQEILAHLKQYPRSKTDFPDSIRAICGAESKVYVSVLTHVAIDACVLTIIWSVAHHG